MLKVKIKLFATLQKGRFDTDDLEFPAGTTIKDITRSLDLDENEVAIIFVNSRHSSLDYEIQNQDTVSFFPPVGGG